MSFRTEFLAPPTATLPSSGPPGRTTMRSTPSVCSAGWSGPSVVPVPARPSVDAPSRRHPRRVPGRGRRVPRPPRRPRPGAPGRARPLRRGGGPLLELRAHRRGRAAGDRVRGAGATEFDVDVAVLAPGRQPGGATGAPPVAAADGVALVAPARTGSIAGRRACWPCCARSPSSVGYLGTLITQTITFAADEFGADRTAQGAVLAVHPGRRARGGGARCGGRPSWPAPRPRRGRRRRLPGHRDRCAGPGPRLARRQPDAWRAGFAGGPAAPDRHRLRRGDAAELAGMGVRPGDHDRRPRARACACGACRSPTSAPPPGGCSTCCRCWGSRWSVWVVRRLPETPSVRAGPRPIDHGRPRPAVLAAGRIRLPARRVRRTGDPVPRTSSCATSRASRRRDITLFVLITSTPGRHRHPRRRTAGRPARTPADRRRRHRRRHPGRRHRTCTAGVADVAGLRRRHVRRRAGRARAGRLPPRAVPDLAAGPGRRRRRAHRRGREQRRACSSSALSPTAGTSSRDRWPSSPLPRSWWRCSCSPSSRRPPTAPSRTSTPRTT